MMRKQNLFFDLDGMKFNTLPAHVSYINKKYGINTLPAEYIGQNDSLDLLIKKHNPCIKSSWEEIYKDVGENFHSSIEWHATVEPMEDMCEVISLLSNKYTLYTVTARQKAGTHVVWHLLDKFIPGCISGVHCVWDHIEDKGFVSIDKKEFIQSVEGENIAFFDDSLNEINKTKDVIASYLFDPMNLHANSGISNRVQTWKQIGERFL